jgi:acyl-CoA reductase-like NAD-dependent aldehyde dehydrogenase
VLGRRTGHALCLAGVDKVAFTGSPATGRMVMAACAERLTPVVLELGGKDAMVVDADADLDAAAEQALWGGMANAGQTCLAVERVYVVDQVDDRFLARLVERASRVRPGPEPGADFGPITLPRQLQTIQRHLEETFGPVLPVVRARDAGHAVALANANPYGLGAAVFASPGPSASPARCAGAWPASTRC